MLTVIAYDIADDRCRDEVSTILADHGRRVNYWVDSLSGVAQGSVISPLLSNVYLTPFDTYLTQKGHVLVRYADNFILLGPSVEAIRQVLDESQAFLQQRLKLQLNAHPRPIASLEMGFVFLGIYFRGNTRRISHG
jgi:RNA-directed DNA polymerase